MGCIYLFLNHGSNMIVRVVEVKRGLHLQFSLLQDLWSGGSRPVPTVSWAAIPDGAELR